MKYLIITIVIVFTFGSDTRNVKKDQIQNSKKNYKVFKIDSVGSYYLIYLKNRNKNYKVISKKEIEKKSYDLIQLGKEYSLNLNSIFNQQIKVKNKKIILTPPIVDCIGFEKNIYICKEKELGINDLHFSSDIYGLSIISD